MMSKRAILAHVLERSGFGLLLGKAIPWSGVLVLNYHRIGNGNHSLFDRGLWSATLEDFVCQLQFCKSSADVISPSDLPQVIKKGRGKYVMITFDDGYRDNFENAFPILKQENVAATFFVTTGFLDKPQLPWWDEIAWMVRMSRRTSISLPHWVTVPIVMDEPDRELAIRVLLRKYKTLSPEKAELFITDLAGATGTGRNGVEAGRDLWMTWDMLREMKSAGMVIGGHTVTHPVLANSSRTQQIVEVKGCGRRLSAELGESMHYFSYPVGGKNAFDDSTRQCLHETGIQYAFSYYGGIRRFDDWDDYDIRRVAVESDLGRSEFCSIIRMPQVFA
jgi:peptidoglycan/xylan/chitin deacetylase (PgdA/CDA1 family)